MSHSIVSGLRLNYRSVGHGPTVLLLHGWGSSCRMWSRTMSCLAEAGYHAVAVDLIGFGDSDKPAQDWYSLERFTRTVNEFCIQMQIESPSIIGHSMGATIALSLAAQHATKVLIVAAPLVNVELNKSLSVLFRSGTSRRVIEWMRRRAVFAALGNMRLLGMPYLFQNPARKRNQQDLRRTTVNAAVGSLRAVFRANLEAQLLNIQASTLIIVGERDTMVPVAQGQLAARCIPNSRLVLWPDTGHQMIDERGDEFDQLVLQQLGSVY